MPSYRPRSHSNPFPVLGPLISDWTHAQHTIPEHYTHSVPQDRYRFTAPKEEWQYRSPPHMFSVCGMGHITRLSEWMKDTHTYTPHWVCRHRLDLVHLSLGPCTSELLPEECLCNCHGRCHASGEHCRNMNRSENKIHFILPLRMRHRHE